MDHRYSIPQARSKILVMKLAESDICPNLLCRVVACGGEEGASVGGLDYNYTSDCIPVWITIHVYKEPMPTSTCCAKQKQDLLLIQ